MSHLIINGGKKLHGAIPVQSSKNSAMAIMFACLMLRGKTTLVDVPAIEDVKQVLTLLKSIGVVVADKGKGRITIDSSQPLKLSNLDRSACEKLRSSLFLMGALASRVKKFKLYKSGGCSLGNRTVRPHLYALKKLGVEVTSQASHYEVRNKSLQGASFVLYESGDTTTENAIMAAVLAKGVTTMSMVSANYMVQDLCYFLREAGAQIEGLGTTTLTITGVPELQAVREYSIMPDPIVAMTMLSAAITTGSPVTVQHCPLQFLELELCKLEVMGQVFRFHNEGQSKNGHFKIVDIEVVPSQLVALPDKIYGRPFPGLNIDNLPLFIPILTQATGRTLVHDWVFEDRLLYSLELKKLGAHITLIDPHRVWVEGPTTFQANEVICPPALRPAVNVLICMLAAKGTSILRHSDVIDRGYENLAALLNEAGADIESKS